MKHESPVDIFFIIHNLNKWFLKNYFRDEVRINWLYKLVKLIPDERILATFIRGCKHDAERVQRKLDHYFSYRTIMPDLFMNRDPTAPDIKNLKSQL